MTRITLQEALKTKGKTDPKRLAASDGGEEMDFDWSNAEIVEPQSKQMISVRLDQDLLDWFKSQGKGYQTRINAILRSYMDAQK